MSGTPLPETIHDIDQLDDLLSTPTDRVIETLTHHPGDLLILGAAGKMGPTLARMAKRARLAAGSTDPVIAVSRFSSPGSQELFQRHGVETIQADLLEPDQLNALPDAPLIVYMAGMKFGATGNESLTWAMNSYLPGMVCQRFPKSRIVAFSTGNVYPFTPLAWGGSVETDPVAPVGEYAMSCLGRERMFEHFSWTLGIPVALLRLNYAVELRYGVPVDIARRVWTGDSIDLGMGQVNIIWQGDANAMALQALDSTAIPAVPINIAGPEQLSVRRIAQYFGERMGKMPIFTGEEKESALLSNGQLGHELFGYPHVPARRLLSWIADWVMQGGASLQKPTHFSVRDGKF